MSSRLMERNLSKREGQHRSVEAAGSRECMPEGTSGGHLRWPLAPALSSSDRGPEPGREYAHLQTKCLLPINLSEKSVEPWLGSQCQLEHCPNMPRLWV